MVPIKQALITNRDNTAFFFPSVCDRILFLYTNEQIGPICALAICRFQTVYALNLGMQVKGPGFIMEDGKLLAAERKSASRSKAVWAGVVVVL